jgi:hypothetical protein
VEGRQYIKLLSSKLEKIVGINKHATADIEPALKSLEPYTAISWWRWLRTTGCFAGVGLLLALMDGGAGAQQQRNVDSAHFMLPHCKRFLDVPGKGTFTEGVCAGSITTLGFVGQVLNKRFCYPASVTNEQMVRLVVAYIEARPARMHEDFRTLALEALREAWPC